MKLNDKTVSKIFDKIREEYKFPPVVLTIHNDKCIPFYIKGMRVCLCLEKVFNENHLKSMMRHELGHIEYAPQTHQNAMRHLALLKQLSRINEVDILTMLLNVIYDIIVDYSTSKSHKNYIENLNPSILVEYKHRIPDNYYWRILQGVYNKLMHKGLRIPVGKKCQQVANKIIRILRTTSSLDENVSSIAECLIFEALREAKLRNQLIQFLLAMTKVISCDEFWKAEKKPDPDARKNSILGTFLRRPRSLRNARRTMVYLPPRPFSIPDIYDDCRQKARNKKIKFILNELKEKFPLETPVGLTQWSASDPVEALEIHESLATSGILIPETTTLQFINNIEENSANQKRKIIVAGDTSGSVHGDIMLTTLFSLIEVAQSHNIDIAIILFSDSEYFNSGFTTDYENLTKNVYSVYGRGGNGNTCSGTILLKQLAITSQDNIIIFLTDWALFEYTEEANRRLVELAKNNNVFSLIFSDKSDENRYLPENINYAEIQTDKDLDNLVINFTGRDNL